MSNAKYSEVLPSRSDPCLLGSNRSAPKLKAVSAQTRTPQLYLQAVTTQMINMIDDHSCWCILFTRKPNFCSSDFRVYCKLILLFVYIYIYIYFFFFLISFFGFFFFFSLQNACFREGWRRRVGLKCSKEEILVIRV